MSRISENIRKITKAWGGKTTGNGISDALSDLYNNLPFGVKTERVEIIPEQSVTHVRLVGDRYQAGFNLPIEGGKDYVVVINGTKYQCVSTEGGTIGNNTTQYPFIFRSDIDSQYWSAELGSPITLEIYEPEVVKQIDAKFVGASGGGAVVVTFNTTDGQNFTADKTLDELLEAVKNGANVVGILASSEYSFMYLNILQVVFEGDTSPKQIEFNSFQVAGNGTVTFFDLNYHSTNGIMINISSCTSQ